MQRRCPDRHERRAERQLTDELWVGNIADIKINDRWGISHRGDLAIRADISRSMKSLRPLRFGLARLLSRHPPTTSLLRMRRIADVENHQDVRAEARHGRRQICILAAWIRIAVRPGRPRLPVRDLPRVYRIADVPDEDAFLVRLVRIGTPSKR